MNNQPAGTPDAANALGALVSAYVRLVDRHPKAVAWSLTAALLVVAARQRRDAEPR